MPHLPLGKHTAIGGCSHWGTMIPIVVKKGWLPFLFKRRSETSSPSLHAFAAKRERTHAYEEQETTRRLRNSLPRGGAST